MQIGGQSRYGVAVGSERQSTGCCHLVSEGGSIAHEIRMADRLGEHRRRAPPLHPTCPPHHLIALKTPTKNALQTIQQCPACSQAIRTMPDEMQSSIELDVYVLNFGSDEGVMRPRVIYSLLWDPTVLIPRTAIELMTGFDANFATLKRRVYNVNGNRYRAPRYWLKEQTSRRSSLASSKRNGVSRKRSTLQTCELDSIVLVARLAV